MTTNLSIKLILVSAFSITTAHSPVAKANWDSIKNLTEPDVAQAFKIEYGTPFRQPLADYGWEDGLQISRNGLDLHALYSPMDLLSWHSFIGSNPGLPFCAYFSNMRFLRSYAKTYGMDMKSNGFGCDSFCNIDILYSHRNTVNDSFLTWQLSGIANPGTIEGGPDPLLAKNAENVDLFLFTTGAGEIWEIKNTSVNPAGMESAQRLPPPINPDSTEFKADNPFVERLNGSDTLILIYEKYIGDGSSRDFMYVKSFNNGATWDSPTAITSVNKSMVHIEHPHFYCDKSNEWWLYYSLNYSAICRSKQNIAGNWDSWANPEIVITKGNALSIGEPSLTADGDISFLLAYANPQNNDSTDVYDCDPWFLPRLQNNRIESSNKMSQKRTLSISVYPNPFNSSTKICFNNTLTSSGHIQIYSSSGKLIIDKTVGSFGEWRWDSSQLSSGIYIACYICGSHKGYAPALLMK